MSESTAPVVTQTASAKEEVTPLPGIIPLTPKIEAVIQRFAPEAETITELQRFIGGTHAMVANVQAAFDNTKDELERIVAIAEVPYDHFASLPELARAVHYADLQVRGFIEAPVENSPWDELFDLRAKALDTADLCIRAGYLDPDEIDDIRKGRGKADLADDGLRLEKVFAELHHLLVGPLVISPGELQRMAELAHSGQGIATKTPITESRSKRGSKRALILLRRQLYTLLVQRYTLFRDTAIAVYGSARIDSVVPTLNSRLRSTPVRSDVLLPELEGADPTNLPSDS